MAVTFSILMGHLPKELAALAESYLLPDGLNDRAIALSGHGELCATISNHVLGLHLLCTSKYYELIGVLAKHGDADIDGRLCDACAAGDCRLVNVLVRWGATDLDGGLGEACRAGQLAAAKLMIAHGATDWAYAENQAAICGDPGIIELLKDKHVVVERGVLHPGVQDALNAAAYRFGRPHHTSPWIVTLIGSGRSVYST